VERHGGQIGVTSRPGATVFTIALPNASATEQRLTQNSRNTQSH
jgi:signal transduction histidine kinase